MRTGRLGSSLVLAVALGLGVGCATGPAEVSSVVSPTANFKAYQTVALENVSQQEGPEFALIEKSIASVLSDKGYRVGGKDSDLTLLYRLTRDRGEKLKEEVIPTAQGTVIRRNLEAVNEAKFLVNLVDTRSGAMAWKGSTVRDLTRQKTPMTDAEIKTALEEFFATLPSNQ